MRCTRRRSARSSRQARRTANACRCPRFRGRLHDPTLRCLRTPRFAAQVPAALSKLDTSGILFFLGVLMAIGALDAAGLLKQLAVALSNAIPSDEIVAAIIGVASALIDNVPLVAATMGMYEMSQYPQDSQLWQLIAYCAGTGGSILVIGSASGVALMGLESVSAACAFSKLRSQLRLDMLLWRTTPSALHSRLRVLASLMHDLLVYFFTQTLRVDPGGLHLVLEEGEPGRGCRIRRRNRRLPWADVLAHAHVSLPAKCLHCSRATRAHLFEPSLERAPLQRGSWSGARLECTASRFASGGLFCSCRCQASGRLLPQQRDDSRSRVLKSEIAFHSTQMPEHSMTLRLQDTA